MESRQLRRVITEKRETNEVSPMITQDFSLEAISGLCMSRHRSPIEFRIQSSERLNNYNLWGRVIDEGYIQKGLQKST